MELDKLILILIRKAGSPRKAKAPLNMSYQMSGYITLKL